MNSSKTVIDNSDMGRRDNGIDIRSGSGMYRQSGKVTQATYVPSPHTSGFSGDYDGFTGRCQDENLADTLSESPVTNDTGRQQRVIVGVMYSVSRGIGGEIYPLYLGMNRIGRDESSDMVLREATVSWNHARMQILRDEMTGIFEAVLSDGGSSYGTSVNGADARYETVKVNDGDIVRIGRHYKFLIRLFNSFEEPLEADPYFETTLPEEIDLYDDFTTGAVLSDDFYKPSFKKKGSDKTVLDK